MVSEEIHRDFWLLGFLTLAKLLLARIRGPRATRISGTKLRALLVEQLWSWKGERLTSSVVQKRPAEMRLP